MTEAKRGRPAIPEAERRQQIGVRTSPMLKLDLERAAGENGRSVAQEAELRLVRSFEEERRHGGSHNAAFIRLLSGIMEMAETKAGGRWTQDHRAWVAVRDAVAAALDANMPPVSEDLAALYRSAEQEMAESKAGKHGSRAALMAHGGSTPLRERFFEALEPTGQEWDKGKADATDIRTHFRIEPKEQGNGA